MEISGAIRHVIQEHITKYKNNTLTSEFIKINLPGLEYLHKEMKSMKQCRGLGRELHWRKKMDSLLDLIDEYKNILQRKARKGGARGGARGGAGGDSDFSEGLLLFLGAILEIFMG